VRSCTEKVHYSNSWSCRRCGGKLQNVVCRMATKRGNPAQSKRTAVCSCTEEIRNSTSTWCRNCAGMPRNCDGRTVGDRRNVAKGGCSFVRSCAGETHNSHLFGLQGSLKPQVELMNRFIVQDLLATVVVEYGAQWSLEKALHKPVVRACAGPLGEELVVINKADEAASLLKCGAIDLSSLGLSRKKITIFRYFSDSRHAHNFL